MCALREPLEDIGRIEIYALSLLFIIIIIIIIIIFIIITFIITVYNSILRPTKQKQKKEKDCTTYDVEIVRLTMEI